MVRRKNARLVNGVLLLNKDQGMTSNRALQRVRGIYHARKAGHTGSLDPLATGLLPVCFGEATKYSRYLLQADKSYRAQIVLGETTDTADAEGQIQQVRDAAHIDLDRVTEVLGRFRGAIEQVPPMFSALKRDGKPLYKLARQGIVLEREARDVTIHSLELVGFEVGSRALLDIDVTCSKGTYIRSLALDIGDALGVGGHICQLHRTQVDKFSIEEAHSLAELQSIRDQAEEGDWQALEPYLLPIECLLDHLPRLVLNSETQEHILRGREVLIGDVLDDADWPSGLVRLIGSTGFIGVGELSESGTLRAKRMLTEEQHKI
ncbi:MAG: tRNA pseudouridine(55) synthase TruB, partial [Pseudomonadota bacterium]